MNPIIQQLTEQQITELILLLDDQQIATAKQLLQQQLNLSEAQAETVLAEFARLNNMTLPSSLTPSSTSAINLNQAAVTHPIIEPSLALAKENPIKKKRILVAIIILVLVIILGLIFG